MTAAAAVANDTSAVLQGLDESGVLRLTLNRPAARNALSWGLMTALSDALDRAAADRECRVVVIAGAGPAFCAGHDLRELRGDNRREALQQVFALCSDMMLKIVRLPKPVIAEVHGIATSEASRPSTSPSASISSHFLWMSEGFAEKVFIVAGFRRFGTAAFRETAAPSQAKCIGE